MGTHAQANVSINRNVRNEIRTRVLPKTPKVKVLQHLVSYDTYHRRKISIDYPVQGNACNVNIGQLSTGRIGIGQWKTILFFKCKRGIGSPTVLVLSAMLSKRRPRLVRHETGCSAACDTQPLYVGIYSLSMERGGGGTLWIARHVLQ